MARLGREGIHVWTSADGHTVELNRRKDETGDPVRPYVKLKQAGSHSLGDADNNADPRVGGDGEIARPGNRRGKTEPYSGRVVASSMAELRAYQAELREAFSNRTDEGRMDIIPHELATDLAGMERYFNARVIGLDMEDLTDVPGYQSTFVLGLRNHSGLTYAEMPDALAGMSDLAILLPLDTGDEVTDLSGNSRNGTEAGGITIGGGEPLTPSMPARDSTTFADTDDAVTTSYNPFVPGARRTYFAAISLREDGNPGRIFRGGSETMSQDPVLQFVTTSATTFTFFCRSITGLAYRWSDSDGLALPLDTPFTFVLDHDDSANQATLYQDGASLGTKAPLGGGSGGYHASAGNLSIGPATDDALDMAFFGVIEGGVSSNRARTIHDLLTQPFYY